MTVIDSQAISALAQVLIAPISLIIASIALWGYIKVGSRSSLFLSISFFLLSCLSFLPIATFLGLFEWPSLYQDFDVVQTIPIINFLALIQIAAFTLLASVYLNEINNRTVRFGRMQLDLLAASLAVVLVFSFYTFNKFPTNSYGHPVIPFFSALLSFILMLVIVNVVFSFYREKGNKNTLIGLIGYLLIPANVAYGILSYDSVVWSTVHNGSGDWGLAIANVMSLTGYLVFLGAIIRMRVSHG